MSIDSKTNSLALQSIVTKQIKSLFIGAVVSETSLNDYALTKKLISYQGGYSADILNVIQKNIDSVKANFAELYDNYRVELLSQIQGKCKLDIFTVCDKYIKSFLSMKTINYTEIKNCYKKFAESADNIEKTNSQKLQEVKKIIEANLFPIFTSFALDLTMDEQKYNLEKYVELKELLNITRGEIDMESAKKYDMFKLNDKKRYKKLIDKLDDKIIILRNSKDPCFYEEKGLSTYMFMSVFYLIFCNKISENMTEKAYKRMLDNIENYEFYSG